MADDPDQPEGTVICENCHGYFLPEDMSGEHCLECTAELFGD